jgi:RNA polymerase sigma-70 factor (ECF subfamily)
MTARLDDESASWVRALGGTGPEREEAIERLHTLLHRAAVIEVARRRPNAGGGAGDLHELADQAANDAVPVILSKLHTYRGVSRFTTWAYKFALLEAAAATRKWAWAGRELPLEAEGWARLQDGRCASPAGATVDSELIAAIRAAIAEVLTPYQRSVLVALTLNDVPIDVLADRRGTTRSVLYMTLHESRRKLRARLAKDGLSG